MTSRASWAVIATAALILSASEPTGASSADAAGARQEVTLEYHSVRPAAAIGIRFRARWLDPENPQGKPYAMKRIVSRLPEGSTYDTSALPQCHASDHELMLGGAAACPAESVVSRGSLVTDSGPGSFLPRHITMSLTMFNSDDEYLTLAEPVDPAVPGMRVVAHNRIRGNTVTSEFPAFPAPSGPDGYMAFHSMQVDGEPKVREGRAYSRLPGQCPRSGTWTTTMDFVYRDGVTEVVQVVSPCGRGPAVPLPRLLVRGVPPAGTCARRPFTVRATVANGSARRLELLLDGRRLTARRREPVRARIPVRSLRAGAHRLVVRARVDSQRLAAERVFRVCARRE